MRSITHIVIHCSDTVDSGTLSWPAIEEFHIKNKGWNTIGYHFGVELASARYEALVGRPLDMEGAHCPQGGMNRVSIGIVAIGRFELQPPPHDQLVCLATRLVIPLMRMFSIPPSNIMFHRDFNPSKTCPGKQFTRALLAQYVPGLVV